MNGKEALLDEMEDVDEEDDFGPSPAKGGDRDVRTFEALLVESERNDGAASGHQNGKNRGRVNVHGSRRGDIFVQSRRKDPRIELQQTSAPSADSNHRTQHQSVIPGPVNVDVDDSEHEPVKPDGDITEEEPDDDRLPTPPLDPDAAAAAEAAPIQTRPSSARVISIEEDELNEWDPETGPVRHEIVIVPTRRATQRPDEIRPSFADLTLDHVGDAEDERHDQTMEPKQPSTSRSSVSYPSTTELPTPLLSVLSIRSPDKATLRRAQLDDLRVNALLDPSKAGILRAAERGQEIFEAGEGFDVDELDLLEGEGTSRK